MLCHASLLLVLCHACVPTPDSSASLVLLVECLLRLLLLLLLLLLSLLHLLQLQQLLLLLLLQCTESTAHCLASVLLGHGHHRQCHRIHPTWP